MLDAIYYLCYTKSYFSAYQQHSVKSGTDGFRLEGLLCNNEHNEENIICKWKSSKKEISSNGVDYEKINDHIGKYAAVMIAPDDIELINDGSEVRRKWIDSILCQTDKEYFEKLMHYQRILLQRNAWLKMHTTSLPSDLSELNYYDQQLILSGNLIFERRKEFIKIFLPFLIDFYHHLASGKENIDISYKSSLNNTLFERSLKEGLQHDLRYQRTLTGIHKDDFEFTLNGLSIKQFGSQGQKKSFLFALKLAQYLYIQKILGFQPILLLDDIFEKLDQERIKALLAIICGSDFGQVVLTDTHAERVKEAFGENVVMQFIAL